MPIKYIRSGSGKSRCAWMDENIREAIKGTETNRMVYRQLPDMRFLLAFLRDPNETSLGAAGCSSMSGTKIE